MVGLRGVGKTVLLNRMLMDATDRGFECVLIEAPEDRSLPGVLAGPLNSALIRVSRSAAARDMAKRARRALAGFVSAMRLGFDDITFSIDLDREEGVADSGDLDTDLASLLQVAGEAAKARGTALVLFIDELQYVEERQLGALIAALHRTAQRQLPVTLIGSGLPQLVGHAGSAKSYAERMFSFPEVGPLLPDAARRAMESPANRLGVTYSAPALDEVLRITHCHPYFLQEWGSACWRVAQGSTITRADVEVATPIAVRELDTTFFRAARPPDRQTARYIGVIAVGPPATRPKHRALAPPPHGEHGRHTLTRHPPRTRRGDGTLPLPLLFRGKVRDVYAVPSNTGDDDGTGGDSGASHAHPPADHLLLVASDRVSAFDVVMDEAVPDKGRVLTRITAWWLGTHLHDIPHHLVSVHPDEIRRAIPALAACPPEAGEGRATLVRRTRPLPVECVVRGYLSGSAWKEYRESGTLAGEPLPPGLVESDPLVPPIYSPATKAREGHDENITFARVAELLGAELADRLRERSLDFYERGRAAAAQAGIILADTKFEFGISSEGELLLIDEVLTPDSSRFWPREHYAPGRRQESLDKQPIRDYLDGLSGWDKRYPPPSLPPGVVAATRKGYREVFHRLTGTALDDIEPTRLGAAGGSDARAPGSRRPAPAPGADTP